MELTDISPSILLVDDNDDHIIITQKILQRAYPDCHIHVETSGETTLQYISNNKNQLPDVVFLDMDLPDATGLDILRDLRNNENWIDVPVWLLSSWCPEDELEKAYELGIRGYFEKPLDRHGIEIVCHLFEHVSMEVPSEC